MGTFDGSVRSSKRSEAAILKAEEALTVVVLVTLPESLLVEEGPLVGAAAVEGAGCFAVGVEVPLELCVSLSKVLPWVAIIA